MQEPTQEQTQKQTQKPASEISADDHENGYGKHAQNTSTGQAGYDKPLLIIGMAKKAGLLAIGSDSVQTASRTRKAKLIVFASDTSPGSIKRIRYEADRSGVISVDTPYTKFEFSNIAGRGSPGTLAILDLGLAEEFAKRLAALDKTRYGEITALIEKKAKAQISEKPNKPDKPNKPKKSAKPNKPNKPKKADKPYKSDKANRADNRRTKI